ncbi:hypothetical protein GOP47_0024005 [Adiantum capillus-veneris]|uniref:Uncharacterized protein n=1 Tax=Adiantum capillus-veneris TaxID=13818 RepID=A0A9D4U5L7_ADICA|nr:hypothetical protein GOP47_0024005 [Adiantum capillus-veneris]
MGESQGVDIDMEKREVAEGQDSVGMNIVEVSPMDVNKPQDEQTKFDEQGAIDKVLLTIDEALSRQGVVEENDEGEADGVKKADSSGDGAKVRIAEKDVNMGKVQDKVTDLVDVDVDATDSEKVARVMPTSPGDFMLSDLLFAVGRKRVHGRDNKSRACKV